MLVFSIFHVERSNGYRRNLEGMFRLGAFSISTSTIIGIIVIGRIVLVSVQYWLTKKTALIAYSEKER